MQVLRDTYLLLTKSEEVVVWLSKLRRKLFWKRNKSRFEWRENRLGEGKKKWRGPKGIYGAYGGLCIRMNVGREVKT